MDGQAYYLIGVGLAAVLAVANVWRGAVLNRQGNRDRGVKHMMLGAVMMMFMVVILLLIRE